MGVAGYCAGSCTRQIGTAALIAVIVAIRQAPVRARWMWVGLAGVALGTIAGYADPPFVDFRGFKAAFEASLIAIELALREGGEVIALLLGLALLRLVLERLRPAWAAEGAPELGDALPWLGTWLGLTLLALCGPRYSEATRFPASLVIVMAALPVVRWLCAVRPLRALVVALVIGIHVIVWVSALRVYIPLGAEYRERIATLERAPAGGVARIEPYREIRPSFWAFGEDLGEASSRQLIAIRLFQLRDIDFSTKFSHYEPNARIAMRFEIEGVTPEQLAASGAMPMYWGTEVAAARGQFERLMKALERTVAAPFSARLVVEDFAGTPDILRGRPLVAAVYERGELDRVRSARGRFDVKNNLTVTVRPARFTTDHPDSHLVKAGQSSPLAGENGRYRFAPMTTELHAIVACNPKRCFLVDAFNPRL